MDKEIWKVYKVMKYGSRTYEVSNKGRVKLNGKIIEPTLWTGYPRVGSFRVHRAVAELFIPNPDNKPCIDHINTDRTDNRVENLRWVSHKENSNNPLSKIHYSNAHKGKSHSELTKQHMKEAWAKRKKRGN